MSTFPITAEQLIAAQQKLGAKLERHTWFRQYSDGTTSCCPLGAYIADKHGAKEAIAFSAMALGAGDKQKVIDAAANLLGVKPIQVDGFLCGFDFGFSISVYKSNDKVASPEWVDAFEVGKSLRCAGWGIHF